MRFIKTDWIKYLYRKYKSPTVPSNSDGRVLIHLGPGEEDDKRFINVDMRPFPHIHIISSVFAPDLFNNNYADLIYACHLLEHISHMDVPNVLLRWNGWLRKDGILRLSVPNFDTMLEIYKEHGTVQSIVNPLMGGQGYKENFHKIIFTEEHLTNLLIEAGFKDVKKWVPDEVDDYNFKDWANKKYVYDDKEYDISLNLQGHK